MLNFLNENWPIFMSVIVSYGWILKLSWKVDDVCKEQTELKNDYKDGIKELKSDLKENVRLLQDMNIALTSLSSFLHGKGIATPSTKSKDKKNA